MNQLGYYNIDINWDMVTPSLLLVVLLSMIILFKKDPLVVQKALWVGGGLFIVAMILNVIGFVRVSDGFMVFAFAIIVITSIRLFWSDTDKLE